jgi:hypothetical protein
MLSLQLANGSEHFLYLNSLKIKWKLDG